MKRELVHEPIDSIDLRRSTNRSSRTEKRADESQSNTASCIIWSRQSQHRGGFPERPKRASVRRFQAGYRGWPLPGRLSRGCHSPHQSRPSVWGQMPTSASLSSRITGSAGGIRRHWPQPVPSPTDFSGRQKQHERHDSSRGTSRSDGIVRESIATRFAGQLHATPHAPTAPTRCGRAPNEARRCCGDRASPDQPPDEWRRVPGNCSGW